MSDSTRIQSGATESNSPFVRKRFAAGQVNGNTFQEELLNLQLFDATIEPLPLEPIPLPSELPEAKVRTDSAEESESNSESEEVDEESSTVYTTLLPTAPVPIENTVPVESEEEPCAAICEKGNEITGRPVPDGNDATLPVSAESEQPLADNPLVHEAELQVDNSGDASKDPLVSPLLESKTDKTEYASKDKLSDAPERDRREKKGHRSDHEEHPEDRVSRANETRKSENGNRPLAQSQEKLVVPEELVSSNQELERPLEIEAPRNRRSERLSKSRNEDQSVEQTIVANAVQPSESVTATASFFDLTSSTTADSTVLSTDPNAANATTATSVSPTIAVTSVSVAAAAITASESVQASKAASVTATTAISDNGKSGSVGGVVANSSPSANTPRSSEVSAGSRPSLTPYQETKLVQRVLRGLEQLSNGGGQVKLRLHPPELGTLQITLRIEANQVSAQLEVENHVAKDALLQNTQALKDRLAEQGLQIERFEVEVRSDSGANTTGQFGSSEQERNGSRWQASESRYAAMNANRLESVSREDSPPRTESWSRTQGTLDLSV